MGDYKLSQALKIMLKCHKKSKNAGDTAAELLARKYYRSSVVCVASVSYWFRFFRKYPNHYPSENDPMPVRFPQRLAFLSELARDNPTWTTEDFMEALKAGKPTIRRNLQRLGYTESNDRWTKPSSPTP